MDDQDFKTKYLLAVAIAAEAHLGQTRDGTSDPYLTHPLSVMGIAIAYGLDRKQQLALVCHDVVEDGGDRAYWSARIRRELGGEIHGIVEDLTDPEFPSDMKRKDKKVIINDRFAEQSVRSQMAKLCDIKHNTLNVDRAKPKFAVNYCKEKLTQALRCQDEVKETELYKDTVAQIQRHLTRLQPPETKPNV